MGESCYENHELRIIIARGDNIHLCLGAKIYLGGFDLKECVLEHPYKNWAICGYVVVFYKNDV